MTRVAIVILMSGLLSFVSCIHEPESAEKVNPNFIYLDYLASGEEESNIVTLKLQFRAGGPNEKAITLTNPATIELDGQTLLPDSSRFNGPYYEVIRAVNEFGGVHHIIFTDTDGKKYKSEFEFPSITLKSKLVDSIDRNDLRLEVEGTRAGDRLKILVTDTSRFGRGIEKVDTMVNGLITISKADFSNLENGPVQLELIREVNAMPDEMTVAGGRFYLTYTLKRQLILLDSAR